MQLVSFSDAARAIAGAQKVVAVTGAGASVESGIPDFRSAGGLWERYPIEEFATIHAFLRDPDRVWKLWHELGQQLLSVEPNAGHLALAELERLGRLDAVITQNIDNLHQRAGNTRVVEYHGNARRLICMSCGRLEPLEFDTIAPAAPRCACGGVQKPDVVFFGEMIPHEAMNEAEALAQTADAVLIVGTSAQVYPAAGLPYTAKEHGATVIECNVERTDFTDTITDFFLEGPAGHMLPRLVQEVSRLL